MEGSEVPGLVDDDLPLRLSTEAGDQKVPAVTGPDHPRPLLGHDVAALPERLVGGPGVVDPDPAVPADSGQIATTLRPAERVDLLRVTLNRNI